MFFPQIVHLETHSVSGVGCVTVTPSPRATTEVTTWESSPMATRQIAQCHPKEGPARVCSLQWMTT